MSAPLSTSSAANEQTAAMSSEFSSDRPAKRRKLQGREFYESIGSPKWVVAPMVDQSEFAWRLLTRSFMTEKTRTNVHAYSPMLHARLFASNPTYRANNFQPTKADVPAKNGKKAPEPESLGSSKEGQVHLDGNPAIDRPLTVQFCANDPEALLEAAKHVQDHCDAVDLNLGCPQGIAKRGHYGAFLQEDWGLIHRLIDNLHKNLDIPVTAKFRIQETREKTLEYAKMILDAGAQIITVHGRRREQKGHNTGVADWNYIRYLRESLPRETVIFANGNILERADLEKCLEETGADGVMSAEGNLHNPALFADEPPLDEAEREYWRGADERNGWRIDAVMRRYYDIIYQHVLERAPPAREPLFIIEDLPALPEAPREKATNGAAPPIADEDVTTTNVEPTITNGKRPAEEDGAANLEPAKMQKISKKQRKKEAREAAKLAAKQRPAQEKSHQINPNDAYISREQAARASNDPNLSAMQAHLFSLLRVFVSVPDARHARIRDQLARSKSGDMASFELVLKMVEERVREGMIDYAQRQKAGTTEKAEAVASRVEVPEDSTSSAATIARVKRPWWVCQSFVRPLPSEALEKGAMTLSRKEKEKLAAGGGEEVRVMVEKEDHQREEGKVETVSAGDVNGHANGKEDESVEIPKDGLVCG